ncbi:hypothetical protein [Plasmodium yoelii yoelii]|uniref:Uncharacterized protein n=1 Tax=Plasmodium yoelii yoelii TaxID=73239 RepID=Q7RK13_PLAYO|nr:hypothetical protein [Plasmodium yoelii yoelii]
MFLYVEPIFGHKMMFKICIPQMGTAINMKGVT